MAVDSGSSAGKVTASTTASAALAAVVAGAGSGTAALPSVGLPPAGVAAASAGLQASPALASAEAGGGGAAGGAADVVAGASGTGRGGAKLEASLLASLQEKIKARASAPEKLKTTGVAFQAVEEVCCLVYLVVFLFRVLLYGLYLCRFAHFFGQICGQFQNWKHLYPSIFAVSYPVILLYVASKFPIDPTLYLARHIWGPRRHPVSVAKPQQFLCPFSKRRISSLNFENVVPDA